MVSIAEGLRMMQGGVDRTGYADMAEGLGNPGLDLIAARRAEAAQAEALKEYERKQAESDEEFSSEIDRLLEGTQPQENSGFSFGGAFNDYFTNPILSGIDQINDTGKLTGSKISEGFDNVMDFMKFNPSTAVQAQIADAMMPYYEQEFDDLVGQGADPMGTALYLSKSATIPGLDLEMGMANGGPVSKTMQDSVDNMKAEVLARKAEEFRSLMEQPLDKPSLDQYTEDSMLMLSERPDSVFLDPPVGIDGNTIQEAPPIGISGTMTDDELTAGYGMPVGTGGVSGQLTVPFENDPMLQLMLEQQLADDLSLNADVSLMEDMDPFFSLKIKN